MNPLRQEDIWDPDLEERYRVEIQRELFRLVVWLHANAKLASMDQDLIKGFHRQAFQVAFPNHAGTVRGQAAPYDIQFGPFRGSPHAECEMEFAVLSDEFLTYQGSLDQLPEEQVREQALRVACLHHARFIKMHPFLDGNGRTGRICVNYFAARYGLKFIEVERPKQRDYEATLAIFIREGRISPLIDFLRAFLCPPGAA